MKKTVLIVDNDNAVKKAVKSALEKGDFKVVEASNGLECLQKLHEGLKPKLIILDAAMPVMSGWKTIYELHKDPKLAKIKAVLFSEKESNPFPEIKHLPNYEKYRKELEEHYIAKPFTPKEILKKVKELTAG